jgi:hypothetical protein
MTDPAAVTPEMKNARMTEFVRLLPLTIELAGLAPSVAGAVFTPDMMEGRAMSIRTAYRIARNLVREIGETG